MRIDPGKLLRFIGLFVPVFIVLIVAYFYVLDYYEPAVLKVANLIMSKMDPPTEMVNSRWGTWQAFDIKGGYRRSFSFWSNDVRHLHFLSIALLPALVLATPAPWRTRFKLLAIALPLLYAAHVIAIVGVVRAHYCWTLEPGALNCRIAGRIFNTSGQLFGAALWALLTFRYWLSPAPPAASPPAASPPAPTPEAPAD